MTFKYRLFECTEGWTVWDEVKGESVYHCDTSLPVSELDLPAMYKQIKDATGIDYTEIQDGFTGTHI